MPSSNAAALMRLSRSLERLQAVAAPDAPGATIVMALKPLEKQGYGSGDHMTFAGCHLDRDRAFEACMGEAAEYIAQDRTAGSEFAPSGDAEQISQFDAYCTQTGRARSWTPCVDLVAGTSAMVPAELCLYGDHPHDRDISTGCAAGETRDRAILHAICEIIERDAASKWWAGVHTGAAVRDPGVAESWIAEARQGERGRFVKLIDIRGAAVIPVVAACSFQVDGTGFACGIKAHPDPGDAVAGALREMVQMEFGLFLARLKLDRAGPDRLQQSDVRHLLRARSFTVDHPVFAAADAESASFDGASSPGLMELAGTLAQRGQRVFVCDLTWEPEIPVARVLVAGLPIPLRPGPLIFGEDCWHHDLPPLY